MARPSISEGTDFLPQSPTTALSPQPTCMPFTRRDSPLSYATLFHRYHRRIFLLPYFFPLSLWTFLSQHDIGLPPSCHHLQARTKTNRWISSFFFPAFASHSVGTRPREHFLFPCQSPLQMPAISTNGVLPPSFLLTKDVNRQSRLDHVVR